MLPRGHPKVAHFGLFKTQADQINECSSGNNCGPFTLGRQSKDYNLHTGRWFRGDIAEVRVYDGLLSSAEADESSTPS